ncbi:MAG: response regulator [Saprospiraceae bacterium]|nr:response regulator [Saprospiraceae bacterium]
MRATVTIFILITSSWTFWSTGLANTIFHPEAVNPLTESWRWKHFPELDGKGVRSISEGPDQRIWLSFNQGVYEYDGYSWRLHDENTGLIGLPVEQVLATANGQVYATTSEGVFSYQGDHWEPLFLKPEGVTFQWFKIRELKDGSVVACSNQGALILRPYEKPALITSTIKVTQLEDQLEGVTLIRLPEQVVVNGDILEISDILEDRQGVVWLAITLPNEEGMILQFHLPVNTPFITNYHILRSNATIQLGETQRMIEASNGAIWIINSTYKTGITIYDGKNWFYFKLSDQFGGDEYIADMVETADGTIWIGSLGKLFAYRKGKWSLYASPDFAIPANRLLLEPGSGDKLWLGGYKSKILLLDYSQTHWFTLKDLNFQCDGQEQDRWFLSLQGKVVHQTSGEWRSYGTEDGLMDAPIRVYVTSAGQVWAAGSHQGVASTALLVGDRWEKQEHPALSWGIDYRAVFESSDGTMWFGAAVDAEIGKGQMGGLLELKHPDDFPLVWKHHIPGEHGLQQSNVYGIAESPDGKIWIGGGSLYAYDGTAWQQANDDRLRQFVNVLYNTDGLLIIGSRYYGVFTYDGTTWKNYSTADGLSGNTIISIDAVNDRSIFVSTENDICRFDGKSWIQHVFPAEMNMELEGGSIHHDRSEAIWINKSSRSWKRRAFSHNKPIQVSSRQPFLTHRYYPDLTPPETEITLYSERVSQEGNTLINWSGLDYLAESPTQQLTYSWRLDQQEWSSYSQEGHHLFTSLPNGWHTLQVRARDLNLNTDPTPAEIRFFVLPPVWKQAWFLTLLASFLLIVSIYEYRVISKNSKLEKLNHTLQLANENLKTKSAKIEQQNEEILTQQLQILEQTHALEHTNRDLEERNKEIELQRDQLEAMVNRIEELSSAKLSFFTNISHELRTPLTLILGPIHRLQEQSSLSAEERSRLQAIIERNAARLLKLINQLLEMRRIEQSTLDLNEQEIPVNASVEELCGLFENLAIERDIVLEFIPDGREYQARLDRDKLEKILVNLLSNAFKHTPDGGKISVQMELVHPQTREKNLFYDQFLQLKVSDTGNGIPPEVLNHIFERFYSTDPETKLAHSTGIGLAYIRDLLAFMHGSIQAESKTGKGTTFIVHIPFIPASTGNQTITPQLPPFRMAREEAESLLSTYTVQTARTSPEGNDHLPRILIVEDHPDMLHFLCGFLEKSFQILQATDGSEGLELAKNHTIDLVISDVMMPVMDGLTFCQQLKSDPVTSHIPVILLTAKVLDEDILTGLKTGADDYVTKPFSPPLLLARIENLLGQRELLKKAYTRDFMLTPQEVKLVSSDEQLLHKLVEMMEENLSESQFNVNKMCEMVHLSHMHFIRKVKQLTGKKPVDLLKSFRMKRAKDLLAQQKLTISEVAYRVGFDLPNSFSRAFKKEFGITPSVYIEQLITAPDLIE